MKKYIIKPLAKVEENDLEGYAVEFAPNTITEAEHRKGLEYIGNCLDSKGVGAWNKGKKAFMVFENSSNIADFETKLEQALNEIIWLIIKSPKGFLILFSKMVDNVNSIVYN